MANSVGDGGNAMLTMLQVVIAMLVLLMTQVDDDVKDKRECS